MRAVRENRDYGSAVRVRYKRLLKMRIRFSLSLTFPTRGRKKPSRRFVVCLYSRKAGIPGNKGTVLSVRRMLNRRTVPDVPKRKHFVKEN